MATIIILVTKDAQHPPVVDFFTKVSEEPSAVDPVLRLRRALGFGGILLYVQVQHQVQCRRPSDILNTSRRENGDKRWFTLLAAFARRCFIPSFFVALEPPSLDQFFFVFYVAMILYRHIASPLGALVIAASETALTGVWFEGQKHFPGTRIMGWESSDSPHPVLDQAQDQLSSYFDGSLTAFALPLDEDAWGTDFQRSVWKELCGIELGSCKTYGELASSVGSPGAARAVGSAVGRNPWSIVVPCHRVVGSDGKLTGYAGGLQRKKALLELDGVAFFWSCLSQPSITGSLQRSTSALIRSKDIEK